MAEQQDVSQDQSGSPKPVGRKRWGRRIALAVAAVGAVVFVVIALLPTLAGTGPGKNMILGVVNGSIDGRVEARSVSLGWLSGQRVEGVNVTGPDGSLLIDNFSLDAPQARLLPIVFGSRSTGMITLAADAVNLRQDEQGNLNVPASTAPQQAKQPAGDKASGFELPEGVDTQLTVTIGKITYERPNEQPRVIRDFKTTAELRGRQKLEVTTTGDIEGGKLDAHVLIDNLTDAAGKLQYDKANIDAKVDLTGIPVAPIDALAGQQGKLVEMLGDTLTTTATASGTLDKFTADVKLPALTLPAGEGKTLVFSDAVAQVRPGQKAGDLRLTLNGRARTGSVTEQVTLTADARNVFGEGGPLQLHAQTQKLPVALVDALAGQGGKLTETLGGTLDLSVDVSPRDAGGAGGSGGWQVAGQLTTPNVAGPFAATYADDLIEASTPQPLRFTITPKAYAMWTGPADPGTPADPARPVFAEAVSGTINLAALRLVMKPRKEGVEPQGLPIDVDKSRISATIDIPTAKIRKGEPAETITAEAIHVALKGETLQALDILAAMEFPEPNESGAADGEGRRGKLVSKTTVRDLFDGTGALALAGATIHSDTTLDGVPGSLLDLLAGQQGKLAATTGPVVNGSVAVDYQPGRPGTAVADLDATNLKGRIPLSIAPGFSAITLTDDAEVTYYATEDAAKSWVGNLHPIFADAVKSDPEHPIRVTLERDAFALPLEGGFDISKAQITGELAIGRMVMRRRGFLAVGIESVVKAIGFGNVGSFGKANDYVAIFSPMTFEIKDGIAKTSEMWLTTDDMGVGFQGSVDLNNNQIKQMSVAILGATLYAAPSKEIRRRVKPDQIFELRIEESISDPKFRIGSLAYDATFDILQGSVDEKTGQYIELGRAILGEVGKKQSKSNSLNFTWHPAENAQAFIKQYQPKSAEQSTTPVEQQPATQQPAEQDKSNESPLRNLFEELRRQSQG